jgi:hypothetical protein
MNILPERVDELIEDHFEAIDRHYPVVFTLTILALIAGAITVAAALDCTAGEFLGLVIVATGLAVFLDCAHRRYYNRVNGRG